MAQGTLTESAVVAPLGPEVCLTPAIPEVHSLKKTYKCRTCQKDFSRQEHRMRHERSHTRERPYPCRYCERCYSRRDLVTRHEKGLHGDIYTDRIRSTDRRSWTKSAQSNPGGAKTKTPHTADTTRTALESDDLEPGDLNGLGELSQTAENIDQRSRLTNSPKRTNIDNGLADATQHPVPPLTSVAIDASPRTFSTEHTNTSENRDLNCDSADQIRSLQTRSMHIQKRQPTNTMQAGDGVHPYSFDDGLLLSDQEVDFPLWENMEVFADFPGSMWSFPGVPAVSNDTLHFGDQACNKTRLSVQHWGSASGFALDSTDGQWNHENSPKVVQRIPQTASSFSIDDHARNMLIRDTENYLHTEDQLNLKFPSTKLLNRFLGGYLLCFHPHYPIFHIPSMVIENTPSPLVLAICTIGALYRLERKHAALLQQWADRALDHITETAPKSHGLPLLPVSALQGRLLLAFAEIFSGRAKNFRTLLGPLDQLSMEYMLRRTLVDHRSHPQQDVSWPAWIEKEAIKRLLCSIYILNSLVSVTFKTTSRFNLFPDAEIEMPSEEYLWNAETEDEWRTLMMTSPPSGRISLIDAVSQVAFGQGDHSNATKWSDFTITTVMHAVNVHLWHQGQCIQRFSDHHPSQATLSTAEGSNNRQSESILSHCRKFLPGQDSEQEQSLDEPGGSRRSNGFASLRMAYNQSSVTNRTLNCMILFSADKEYVMHEIAAYIQSGQKRSSLATKTAALALDGILTAVKAGPILARKIACLTWSIDHAIADWDCALFVTRWLYSLECSHDPHAVGPAERHVFDLVKELLADADVDYTGETSLAAEIIRLWADFLDDTWVWGITPRMASVMRSIASFCDNGWQAHRASPNSLCF